MNQAKAWTNLFEPLEPRRVFSVVVAAPTPVDTASVTTTWHLVPMAEPPANGVQVDPAPADAPTDPNATLDAAPPDDQSAGDGSTPSDPAAVDEVTIDPSVSDPTATDPNEADPTVTDPTSTDPTITDPTLTDPTATDPSADGEIPVDVVPIDWLANDGGVLPGCGETFGGTQPELMFYASGVNGPAVKRDLSTDKPSPKPVKEDAVAPSANPSSPAAPVADNSLLGISSKSVWQDRDLDPLA